MSTLRPLGEHVAAHQDARKRRVAAGAWGRERFVNAVAAQAAPRAQRPIVLRRWRFCAVGALALAGAAALVVFAGTGARRPVTFSIGDSGGGDRAGEIISAPGDRPLPLRFSDGTRFDLQPATRARVLDPRSTGARVVIDRGQAHIAVPPGRGGLWFVEAGPFRVRIVGTRLDVTWRDNDGRVVVSLHEGHVEVSGGALPGALVVGAGQTLTASLSGGDWRLSPLGAPPEDGPTPAVAPRDPPGSADAPTPTPTPAPPSAPARVHAAPTRVPRTLASAPAPAPLPAWRQLAAAGQFQAAMQRAEDQGLAGLCATASATDLLTLSEVARFAGRPTRAREVLLALRRRFGGQAEASVAAFVLGRLAFEDDRDYAGAARWFQRYLAVSAGAPLAREAAGRLIEALSKSGDQAAAREMAGRYLTQYPGGPHARFAAEVLAGSH